MIPVDLFSCEVCDRIHSRDPEYIDGCRYGPRNFDMPADAHRDILDQARDIVRHGAGAGHANRDPGAVEMERLGCVWGALLGREPIDGRTVALMMVGVKLVRGTKRIDPDDIVDAAGYLLIASDAE